MLLKGSWWQTGCSHPSDMSGEDCVSHFVKSYPNTHRYDGSLKGFVFLLYFLATTLYVTTWTTGARTGIP